LTWIKCRFGRGVRRAMATRAIGGPAGGNRDCRLLTTPSVSSPCPSTFRESMFVDSARRAAWGRARRAPRHRRGFGGLHAMPGRVCRRVRPSGPGRRHRDRPWRPARGGPGLRQAGCRPPLRGRLRDRQRSIRGPVRARIQPGSAPRHRPIEACRRTRKGPFMSPPHPERRAARRRGSILIRKSREGGRKGDVDHVGKARLPLGGRQSLLRQQMVRNRQHRQGAASVARRERV